jgi:glutathione S-transferase
MNSVVIWGRDNSVNVQKVLWCCEEIGLPYVRIDAGGPHGVVDTPHYRALNPNSLVPTMDEDGFILWESNAIVRYLSAKYATHRLWPVDPRMRALADQWMDWQTSTFWPALRPLFIGLIRTEPSRRDAQALEYARAKTAGLLEIMDAHLQSRPYIAGDDFTPADIALGACTLRWMELPIEREEFAYVRRWFERLVERPAFRKVVMRPLT